MDKQPGGAACFALLGCTPPPRWTTNSSWAARCYPDGAPRTSHGAQAAAEARGRPWAHRLPGQAQPGPVTRDARTARGGRTGGLPTAAKPDLRHERKHPRARGRQGRPQRGPARGGGLQVQQSPEPVGNVPKDERRRAVAPGNDPGRCYRTKAVERVACPWQQSPTCGTSRSSLGPAGARDSPKGGPPAGVACTCSKAPSPQANGP